MASMAADDKAVFGDEFMADEILARLPARCAVRCTVLSKRFRKLLVSQHFWLRQRRLGAPLELPHAAGLQHHRHGHGCNTFYSQLHVAGPKFVIQHAVQVEHDRRHASTCNGLVLLSSTSYPDEERSSLDGVIFNPATKEEAWLSLQLPNPGKEGVERDIIGFGYGPSTNVYKALIHQTGGDSAVLMVVSLDGRGGLEPRTVFSSDDDMNCEHSLHTADGKVYLLIHSVKFFDNWNIYVLAFDVDSETVIRITVPEGHYIADSMLQVHGRPCIYAQKGQDTVLWLLTADYRWEQQYILVKESSQIDDYLKGAWECGGGLLFAEFYYSGAYMYNLHKAVREEKEGNNGSRITAVGSMKIEGAWFWLKSQRNIWDYQPTLISPASIFGNDAFSAHDHASAAPKDELVEKLLEITQQSVASQMVRYIDRVVSLIDHCCPRR